MSATCPAGHTSTTTDYCDTCGAAIDGSSTAAPASAGAVVPPAIDGDPTAPLPAAPVTCPNCGSPRGPADVFCEVCGLDFATGRLPEVPTPPPTDAASTGADPADGRSAGADTGWRVVVEADRDYFETNEAESGDVDFPASRPARELPLRGDVVLIGRSSAKAGFYPDIDLGADWGDPGVSRKHVTLERDADGWVVVDQGSTNGTRVAGQSDAIPATHRVPLAEGSYVNVGAWTRITLRRTSAGSP